MMRSEVSIPGSPTESNVGRFDAYNNATSRIIMHVSASLVSSNMFTHTFGVNYRSGYKDQVQTADDAVIKEVNADGTLGDFVGIERRVSSNTTYDWQTQIKFQKAYSVTIGIKNILDTGPSFSVRTAGGGNQVGYDGRYNSPLGRQFYLAGSAKF
jgi:iron complex outermembrane receptor protein